MPEEASIVAVNPVDVVGNTAEWCAGFSLPQVSLDFNLFLDIADHFARRSVGTNPKPQCTRFGSEWRDLE